MLKSNEHHHHSHDYSGPADLNGGWQWEQWSSMHPAPGSVAVRPLPWLGGERRRRREGIGGEEERRGRERRKGDKRMIVVAAVVLYSSMDRVVVRRI